MKQYIFCTKYGINTVNFYLPRIDKYKENKHGIKRFTIELNDNVTRKEINWNLRNYSNMWSFFH